MLSSFTDTPRVNNIILDATGTLAFDIGANGGFVSNVLAKNFESVVACEPAIESYARLQADANINVKPLNVAVSDHAGSQDFRVTRLTAGMGELFTGHSLQHWGPTISTRTLPCVTLDSLADDYGMPDFVKIDTEGHELKIVDGGHRVFMTKPRFVIEIHDEGNGTSIGNWFKNFDIKFTVIRHHMYKQDTKNWLNHYWMVNK